MYPEPSAPFYMVLSVYVPLLVIAFFAVYACARLFVCALTRVTALWNTRGRGATGTQGMHLPPAPGRA